MRFLGAFRIAFRALLRNKTRATLTMLGVIFGVGAVIATVSLGDGARVMVQQQIATMGENVILVYAGNFSRGGVSYGFGNMPTLTAEDLEAIRREIPGVRNVSPEVRSSRQVIAGSQNAYTSIYGVSPEYFPIRSWTLKDGDFSPRTMCAARPRWLSLARPSRTNFSTAASPSARSCGWATCPSPSLAS